MDRCFCVPYGKSFCQVGDLSEQNGTYKIQTVKEEHEILTFWIEHKIGETEVFPTDIILVINKAWVKSFSEVEPNKKSVA